MLPAELTQQFQSLIQQEQLDQLLVLLQEAVHTYPQEPDIHHLLGFVRTRQRRFDDAIGHFQEAIRLKPDAAGALNNLGMLLLEQDRHGEALEALKSAVRANPASVEALTDLSLALARVGFFEHALPFLEEAIRLDPNCADAHHYLGYVCMSLDRVPQAERHLAIALQLRPGTSGYLSSLGLLREKQRRPEEATALFEQAVDADPTIAEPWNNAGNIQAAVWGNYVRALQYFEKTLSIRPLYAEAKYHRGMVELTLGDFEHGWTDYESRPTIAKKSRQRYCQPRWQGEPLAGKTILLHSEQGLGDTFQFIRYSKHVKNLGATVHCEVQKSLLKILASTPGIDVLVEENAPLPPHDLQIPLLSVPLHLGIPPGQAPYLFASEERLTFWKDKIAQIPGFKIGVAWQGEPHFKYDWLRSVPLTQFAPLARLQGHSLISLQKHQGLDQIAANHQLVPLIELQPEIDAEAGPFMDTAAIMKHLDLVICSDSAIAHLAGGLGVPVWMATSYAPDWRWMTGRLDSPWYPSMRLYRQSQVGRWENVFESMAADLASGGRQPTEADDRQRSLKSSPTPSAG